MSKKVKYSCQHRPAAYTLLNTKPLPVPKDNTYYWHIANFPETMDKYKVILAFTNMMQIWQRAIDQMPPLEVKLNVVSTNDISKAHFVFSFGPFEHDVITHSERIPCSWPFDGDQGVLAHAWPINEDYPLTGQVHFDASEKWDEMHGFEGARLHVHLLTVALHETGHAWGIGHAKDKIAIMAPIYDGVKTMLTDDDISALNTKIAPIKQLLQQAPIKPSVKRESFLRALIDLFIRFFS